MTLEKVFYVPQNHICHIHGLQGSELIFGHGNDENLMDEFESSYIGAEFELNSIHKFLRKDTMHAIEMNSNFFDMLSKFYIYEIYSWGFSFSNVDMIYIKKIVELINGGKNCIWYISGYDKWHGNFKKIKNKIKKCGFLGRFCVFKSTY